MMVQREGERDTHTYTHIHTFNHTYQALAAEYFPQSIAQEQPARLSPKPLPCPATISSQLPLRRCLPRRCFPQLALHSRALNHDLHLRAYTRTDLSVQSLSAHSLAGARALSFLSLSLSLSRDLCVCVITLSLSLCTYVCMCVCV